MSAPRFQSSPVPPQWRAEELYQLRLFLIVAPVAVLVVTLFAAVTP